MHKYILVTQFFPPDPTAVGQQVYDLALSMSKKKIETEVLTSNSNYNNPRIKYKSKIINKYFHIKRLPISNLGKKNFFFRIGGQILFILVCFFYLKLFTKNNYTLIITTSPSISSILGTILNFLNNKLKIIYWVSDINPDQSVKLNIFKKNNFFVKVLNFFEKQILERSTKIITLDNYMKKNLKKKIVNSDSKIKIIPPWCHEEKINNVKIDSNPFIKKYNLKDKFRVIYSGNHSIANPLITFFKSAKILEKISKIQFIFIGEGNIKSELASFKESKKLKNILMLPYVNLNQLKYTLSAADICLVSAGNAMNGIIHTSKHYSFLKMGKPFLYLGPQNSSIGNLIKNNNIGWQVNHNNFNECAKIIKNIFLLKKNSLSKDRRKMINIYKKLYTKEKLIDKFIDNIL